MFYRYQLDHLTGAGIAASKPLKTNTFFRDVPDTSRCTRRTGAVMEHAFQHLFEGAFDRYTVLTYHPQMAEQSTQDPTLGITLLPALTARQLQVLSVIHRMVIERQLYPTQRELAQALGFTQTTTGQHMGALVKKGYLSKALGEARRNVRLTPLALERLKSQVEGQPTLL